MSLDKSFSREERLFDRSDKMAKYVPYAIVVLGAIALAGATIIGTLICRHYYDSSNRLVIENNSGAEHLGGQR
jgi:capsular polysaccharide biosynthesis protein